MRRASEPAATPAAHPRLYAVVATYQRPQVATRAVQALLDQARPPDGIILVENALTPELDGAFPADQVETICTGANLGAAGGFGVGADVALERGATHVVFVDDDCILRPDALQAIERHIIDGPLDAVLGPIIVGPGTNRLVWPIERPDGSLYARQDDLPLHPLRADHLAFHGLTVSAQALRRSGGPRKDLFFGGPDVEFGLRLGAHGYPIYYCPDAVAEHHEVDYRHFWLFGPRKLPAGTPGHRYYVLRNRLLMWRIYRRQSAIMGVGREVLRETVGALISRDRRWQRLRLLGAAIRDGMIGDPHRNLDNAVSLER